MLPDHLDESLELFDGSGTPVGELFHEPIGGRVVWEIAPGRPGPPDAGPQFGLSAGQVPLGWFATGLVAADVKDRNSPAPSTESALSAALRAIDTTLWTVDTFAGLGSEHIAGLVGRPIAVVRAHLWLELQPEDLLDLSDPSRAEERRAAEAALAAEAFPVRLGELTRTDDGLLGFFVDDDFEHLHLVDRVVAALAKPLGPEGHLSEGPAPIEHRYLVKEDTITVHFGQRLTLTLLLHPAGRVHLTSGVLPRRRSSWRGSGWRRAWRGYRRRCARDRCSSSRTRCGYPRCRCSAPSRCSHGATPRRRGATTRSWPRPRPRSCPTDRRASRRATSV